MIPDTAAGAVVVNVTKRRDLNWTFVNLSFLFNGKKDIVWKENSPAA